MIFVAVFAAVQRRLAGAGLGAGLVEGADR
jgi:hypothetical protein